MSLLTDPEIADRISTTSYQLDDDTDFLTLTDDADGESVVLTFAEQIKLLAVLIKEHTDLAESILKEVRRR